MEFTVTDMRAANKPGYIAQIVDGKEHFLSAKSYDSYGTSAKKVTYEVSEDGIYKICDANFGSRKRDIKFIKIENGEITKTEYSLADIITSEMEFPELEGSTKQIDWADNIRKTFITKLKAANKELPDYIFTTTSAKFWIDNRAKL